MGAWRDAGVAEGWEGTLEGQGGSPQWRGSVGGRGWVPSKMFSLPCQPERVETFSPERGLLLTLTTLYQWGENCLMKGKGAR